MARTLPAHRCGRTWRAARHHVTPVATHHRDSQVEAWDVVDEAFVDNGTRRRSKPAYDGGSQSFGFKGTHSGTNTVPAALSLNGTACAAG